MTTYLVDGSGNRLTSDDGLVDLTAGSGSGPSLVAAAGGFTFSGLAAALTERAVMVLRLRYRKF